MVVTEMKSQLQAGKPQREEQNLVRVAAVGHHCHLSMMLLLLSLTRSWPPHPLLLVVHLMLGMVHDLWRGSVLLISVTELENEEWSSQYIIQFKQLERKSLENQGFNGIQTRDL